MSLKDNYLEAIKNAGLGRKGYRLVSEGVATKGVINSILSGSIPLSKNLDPIARRLGVTVEWLLGQDKNRAGSPPPFGQVPLMKDSENMRLLLKALPKLHDLHIGLLASIAETLASGKVASDAESKQKQERETDR